MNALSFLTLIKRETWEHRSLVWVPVVTAALIVVAALVSSNVSGSIQLDVDLDGESAAFFARLAADEMTQAQLFSIWMGSLGIPVLFVSVIVLFFYLLDALYAERKDRSILFWKSMPVSDAATVVSKLVTALVAMPIWIWAVSLVMGLCTFAIIAAKVSGTPIAPLGQFHLGAWVVLQLNFLQNLLLASLWYAPIAAWLLLISVWAKRAPFLWAVLPPALVMLFEEIIFNTEYVAQLVGYRLTHFFEVATIGFEVENGAESQAIVDAIQNTYDRLSAISLLGELHLYSGLAVAAAFVVAAIRLRRWRDDA
jgi:ABC-2 type transport system permease protein